jgi:predicted lipase
LWQFLPANAFIVAVVTVGHSLGAAIASLDALYLSIALPHLDISARQFALPRVGNPAWSSYYSSYVPDSIHVTTKDDPVPRLPSAFLGFAQLEGEVWIVRFCPPTN